ncbi:PepSY domain-containing protein [Breznakia pachnodae]|uniref:Membrane protein YkoI n=1 Tax=Breznakia pachnodae TaxID=265178 RepID=A0ABU0E6Z7_9FIRM|nr:PepSY domain-containing protein [Breznakia pachnodae]MDQ0362683.1 putative membrane protein YkoI [Breznakia pachnodae]
MNKYLITGAIVLFLLAGCSSGTSDDTNKVNDNKTTDTNKNDSTAEITLEEAKEIALADVNGEVTKQQEDYDDGVLYYEIDIVSDGIKYEYKIDTAGTIVSKEQEAVSTGGTTNDAYITSQEAQDIIIKHAGGGTVTSCELEVEGTAIYEIEMVKDGQEYDAGVDATTGEVLYYNADY